METHLENEADSEHQIIKKRIETDNEVSTLKDLIDNSWV